MLLLSTQVAFGIAVAALPCPTYGQDSAPSSHMVFDDNFPGDVIVNQVRVPKSGQAMYTYYEALGWRGKAAGYAGIQVHPRGHNFIFSIWDHKEHREPIAALYRGPGTLTERFGGEGTGLKSWNFELGWKPDVWYTLVGAAWSAEANDVRTDDAGAYSDFGFWAQAGDTQRWTHLVTMRVAVADARFQGATDAFIEDWLNTGETARTTQLRGGWKRKLDGAWHPFQSARYSVNAWDLVPGKRSHNYRNAWNGGVAGNPPEQYYFMVSGGKETQPLVKNPSQHALERQERQPRFPPVRIKQWKADRRGDDIHLTWEIDDKSSPQFAYQWRMTAKSNEDATSEAKSEGEVAHKVAAAHHRGAKLPIRSQLQSLDTVVVQLRVQDIFGNWSPWQTSEVH